MDYRAEYFKTHETNRYSMLADNVKYPSKTDYAKADWTVWTAALNNDQQIFRRFIYPLYKYMNENKNRVPMADTYNIMNQKTRVPPQTYKDILGA